MTAQPKDTSETDMDAALAQCASEPVHIPGRIQPNGAMIAVDNEALAITHASENLQEVLGLDPEAVLGKGLTEVFAAGVRHDLVNGMLPSFMMMDTRVLGEMETFGRTVFVGASAAGPRTIFEFEPVGARQAVSRDASRMLALLTAQLNSIDTRKALFEKSVVLMQVLAGYDRVMVYEFDQVGNGTVRAEAVSGDLEPYLNLNFPAWDIPEQARKIMARTPIRYIADVHQTPVAVRAQSAADAPLDMTHSHLRGVSPVHMEYLSNMGSQGTLTLNIVVEGKLWGLIALHHPAPRIPDQITREVCRHFARFFGLKLDTLQKRDRIARLDDAEQLRRSLRDAATLERSEELLSSKILAPLCDAMHADGALLVKSGEVRSHGLVPPQQHMEAFMRYCADSGSVFHSAALAEDAPDVARLVGSEIAGLHLTPMLEDSFVAFFRRDRELETMWAGAPDKTIVGTGAAARLQPRGSFAAYKETVRGTALPWENAEHQIAGDVWSILVSAERKALVEKTTRQQKILIDELNHRVRNILTLIRALSRQSRTSAATIDEYVGTLEARIEAVANAHSLAVERPEAFVSVRSILALEAKPYTEGVRRVVLEGADVGLRPDVAPIFALVIHELMTNAAKYGALSKSEGRVSISVQVEDGGLTLHWAETGGPEVRPPTREGFGSTLLKNAVHNELRGSIAIDYRPEGVTATLSVDRDMLSSARYQPTAQQVDTEAPKRAQPGAQDNTRAARGQLRCLLVDDSFVVSLDTLQILNDMGLTSVQTAMNVADAIGIIEHGAIEFAVLDVNLSGGETSSRIARRLQRLGIPFVFVTGYGSQGVSSEAFPNIDVLRKPLGRVEMERILARMGL